MTLQQIERLRSLAAQIQYYDEMAERLRSRAERLTTTLSGMPTGAHGHDEMADIVAQIVDNERKAAERVVELRAECAEAERWIDTLPEQQQRVMRAYYIDGATTWRAVADKLPFAYSHVLRIRDAAFCKIGKDEHK